ncbi:MAG: hypothetical protein ACK40M_06680 [Flavobacteriales bacterium]
MISLRSNYFKTKKPRQFSYLPRYYNERKENLELRKKAFSNEAEEISAQDMETRIRQGFSRGGIQRNHNSRNHLRQNNTNRMVILVGLICTALYVIYKMDLWEFFF